MAKFNDKNIRLKDGEKVTLGTDQDANLWYDGVAEQLSVDVTISGVTPTEDYHLTTKKYVDSGIATLSGSLIFDHGSLTGLEDDDHPQYVPTDGLRGFTSTVSGVTPVADSDLTTKGYVDGEISVVAGNAITAHDELSGLGDDDHIQYTRTDGLRGFTSTVSGITPVADFDLTTKGYVDGEISAVSGNVITDHGGLSGLGDDDHAQYIRTDGLRGFTSTVSGIDPVIDSDLVTKYYVDNKVGSSTFLSLTDTPNIYSGYENYYVKVNATGDALDFIAPNIIQEGVTNLTVGTTSVSINIGATLPSSDYTLTVSLENEVDATPSIYPTLIRGKTNDSFVVDFSDEIDSSNYYLNWRISLSSVGSGISVSDGSITFDKMADIPPVSFIGRNTTTSGIPEALSVDTVKTMLGIGSGDGSGVSTEDVIALIIALGG